MFSILIPTWNNLKLLQLCIRSIRENSSAQHQIIIHVNEGSDGSLAWVKEQGIEHTFSEQNIGICYAMNEVATLSKHRYIYYLNDDMYCCPGWDKSLLRWVSKLDGEDFMLASRAIEPPGGLSPCATLGDYGYSAEDFREKELLQELDRFCGPDFYAGGCAPSLVTRESWFKLGGYGIEFSPGMNSDNDFAMKMWNAGCRIFIGSGESLIYHFRSQSTSRYVMNNGARQFLDKWGISSRVFRKYFLLQDQPLADIALPNPELSLMLRMELLRGYLKRMFL